jgi:hypothetical protein
MIGFQRRPARPTTGGEPAILKQFAGRRQTCSWSRDINRDARLARRSVCVQWGRRRNLRRLEGLNLARTIAL